MDDKPLTGEAKLVLRAEVKGITQENLETIKRALSKAGASFENIMGDSAFFTVRDVRKFLAWCSTERTKGILHNQNCRLRYTWELYMYEDVVWCKIYERERFLS